MFSHFKGGRFAMQFPFNCFLLVSSMYMYTDMHETNLFSIETIYTNKSIKLIWNSFNVCNKNFLYILGSTVFTISQGTFT